MATAFAGQFPAEFLGQPICAVFQCPDWDNSSLVWQGGNPYKLHSSGIKNLFRPFIISSGSQNAARTLKEG